MHNSQNITNYSLPERAPGRFSLKIRGRELARPVVRAEASEGRVFVYCDLCSENAEAGRAELRQRGWDIGSAWAFCPDHAEMI